MRRAEPEYPMFKPRRMSSSVPTKLLDGVSRSPPSESSEWHPAAAQRHPLLLEQDALGHHAAHRGTPADLSACVHHAMPRHARGTAPHRAAHHASPPGPAEPRGDLPVGRHPAPRDLAHLPPYAPLEGEHEVFLN